jgi:hypothetical protein
LRARKKFAQFSRKSVDAAPNRAADRRRDTSARTAADYRSESTVRTAMHSHRACIAHSLHAKNAFIYVLRENTLRARGFCEANRRRNLDADRREPWAMAGRRARKKIGPAC